MKTKKLVIGCLAVLLGMAFTGCSKGDDNDSSTLETPTYESVSGLYNIQGSSTYSSIELSASGNYIITGSNLTRSAARVTNNSSASHKGFLYASKSNNLTRSANASNNGVIYGTFTVNSDGTINLKGYGTLKITYGSNGTTVTNMTLTPTGKSTVTLNATKADSYSNSDMTNNLCRTWNMASYAEKEYGYGKLEVDIEGTFDVTAQKWSWNVKTYTPGDFDESDYIFSQVLFSKSGTYLVYYTNGTAMLANWKWKDESAGTFYYKEVGDADYDEDSWATASFSGSKLTISEKYEDENDSENIVTVMKPAN